jgi:dihydroorotate dehydrogenase
MIYPLLYRHVLSLLEAERAHHMALRLLAWAGEHAMGRSLLRLFTPPIQAGHAVHAMGMNFPHPLGLAGGFDKDAVALPALAMLGFSHIEIGTVTPLPQPGNPAPRMFRLPKDKALINRMGFPSAGMQMVAERLRQLDRTALPPLWLSAGKNKETPLEDAAKDYAAVIGCLRGLADAFTINISSPNTSGLRTLQEGAYLAKLIGICQDALGPQPAPLLIKIAPDLSWEEINSLVEVAIAQGVAGVVATNTTTERIGLHDPNQNQSGGLSGAPLRAKSTEIVRYIKNRAGDQLSIVGVGGIFNKADLQEKLEAGASLAQAYTGFIYGGPYFVRTCLGQ